MGIRDVFQSGAQTIVAAFGNVAESNVAYHSLGTFSYNATTGAQTESGGTDTTADAIFDQFRSDEIQDRDIKLTDEKMMVANLDISVTPKVGDYITRSGVRYNIVSVVTDPAEALYILAARKT